jgi:hypothetical protein
MEEPVRASWLVTVAVVLIAGTIVWLAFQIEAHWLRRRRMKRRVVQIIPAAPGWRAVFCWTGMDSEEREEVFNEYRRGERKGSVTDDPLLPSLVSAPVTCWAMIEDERDTCNWPLGVGIVGMHAHPRYRGRTESFSDEYDGFVGYVHDSEPHQMELIQRHSVNQLLRLGEETETPSWGKDEPRLYPNLPRAFFDDEGRLVFDKPDH